MNPAPEVPSNPEEAFHALVQRVGRRSPKIPAESLVRHIMAIVPPGEWPVRVEATEALIRRVDVAKKDKLRIGSRPTGGRVLGPYATRRGGSSARPYRTVLQGVEPIAARCDCPDFLKNSMAVCKHALAILEHIYAHPRLLQKAIGEQAEEGATSQRILSWNPIRPLTGEGDWLDRVSASRTIKTNGRPDWASRWFRAGNDEELVLKRSFADDPNQRLDLVEDLIRASRLDTKAVRDDPALQALLTNERERLKRLAKWAMPASEVHAGIKTLKRPLYPYQIQGVERFLAKGRMLLADDMGLGKTAQAITSCELLWRSRRIRRGLIIAPASLKPQWAREWASFSDLPIRIIEGTPSERQAVYESHRTGLFIINYEQLIRDLDIIRRWGPDLVVLDEAQRIKNWATKTALSVKRLEPTYRLVLTGTPMENRIEELSSIVEWVDEMAMEPKWRLNSLHAVYADGRHEVTGARNLDTIRIRLRNCMVRRVRQDVLDQLPSRTDTRVPIQWTEEQKGEHDSLIQPIAQLVQKAKSRPLTQPEFLRLMSLLTTQRIISNGLAQLNFEAVWPSIRGRPAVDALLNTLDAPKLGELRQLVRQIVIEQGRKVVIFSQWRRMLALSHWAAGDILAERGLRAGFFTGAEGQKRRTQNIVEFHDDPDFRVLFASDAGGVGLNLQHAANCVINLELPWNPAVLEQRIGRIYRLGQTRPIDVFNLVCEEGIESRIASLVGAKQALFKGLFDGESDAVQFEQSGSFLSRVEKLYEPSASPITSVSDEDVDAISVDLADSQLDDEVADAFEELLETADESIIPAALPPEVRPIATAPSIAIVPSSASIGEPEPSTTSPLAAGHVRQLFAQLQIRRGEGGKVVIEAPPEAASALGALFEGMAALLRESSREPVERREASSTSAP